MIDKREKWWYLLGATVPPASVAVRK